MQPEVVILGRKKDPIIANAVNEKTIGETESVPYGQSLQMNQTAIHGIGTIIKNQIWLIFIWMTRPYSDESNKIINKDVNWRETALFEDRDHWEGDQPWGVLLVLAEFWPMYTITHSELDDVTIDELMKIVDSFLEQLPTKEETLEESSPKKTSD